MKGPHGALLPNPNGGKRRVRERVYGTVVKAVGQHKWEVTFNFDGVAKEVTLKSLQLASEGAGIPVEEITSSERCGEFAAAMDSSLLFCNDIR